MSGKTAKSHHVAMKAADGAELTADELQELAKAKEVLSFLDQVRIDLGERAFSKDVENEAEVSTLRNANTISEQSFDKSAAAIAGTVGRFEILETIGQGGFARVFRAYDPMLNRDVALKIPKPHALVSEEAAKRFQRESQAAAILSHPAIVPVFESGEVGLISYIASEYCQGETLASWFRNEDRDIDARLAASIVARLSEAVHHAHQRGVIHRDLKPANILLDNSQPDKPVAERVRITDFGLAKQLDSSEESFTLEGAVVGTPAYMSPEQAQASSDISAATDVYSLGVILFELLSSKLPFDKKNHLKTLRAVEMQPAPVLARIDRSIPRDLSAICERCLNKSPHDRYVTAFDLANDLNAWLQNRPVSVHPTGIVQRVRKWFVRNPALGSAFVFAFLSLTLGLAASLWQWNVAVANADRADAQLEKTRQATQVSKNRLDQIENFAKSLTGIFEDLNLEQIEHSGEPLHEVMARRLIVVGAQLDEGMVDDRLVEAELKTELAESLIALGFATEAVELSQSAVEIRSELLSQTDLLTAESITCLGEALRENGQYKSALTQHERAKNIYADQLGPNHDAALASLSQVAVILQRLGRADESIEVFEMLLAERLKTHVEQDPKVLTIMNNLAAGYSMNGQYELAETMYKKVLDLREQVLDENHYDTLTSMDQLARCYLDQKKTEDALELFEETLQRRADVLGPTHPATLISMSSLASGYRANGKLKKALELFEQVLEMRKVRLGEHHELTYSSLHNLGVIHFNLKNFEEARTLLEQSYEGFKNQLDNDHPKALINMQNLAATYDQQKSDGRPIELMHDGLALTREKLSPNHPDVISGLKNLARGLLNRGRYEEALEPQQQLIEALTAARGANAPETIDAIVELGNCYCWAGEYELAIEKLAPALSGETKVADHDYYRRTLRLAYARSGRLEEFQAMADEDLDTYRQTLEPNSKKLRSMLANLGFACLHAENFEMAENLLRESVEILKLLELNDLSPPMNKSILPMNKSMLGQALMGLDEFDQAKSLLEEGYEGLKQHEETMHPLIRADKMIGAAERLLRFYQHVEDEDAVKRTEEELEQLRTKYHRP